MSFEKFDGTTSRVECINIFCEDLDIEDHVFRKVVLLEYKLPSTHDAILSKPWLFKYNPVINWRNNKIFDLGFSMEEAVLQQLL